MNTQQLQKQTIEEGITTHQDVAQTMNDNVDRANANLLEMSNEFDKVRNERVGTLVIMD